MGTVTSLGLCPTCESVRVEALRVSPWKDDGLFASYQYVKLRCQTCGSVHLLRRSQGQLSGFVSSWAPWDWSRVDPEPALFFEPDQVGHQGAVVPNAHTGPVRGVIDDAASQVAHAELREVAQAGPL